MKRRLRKDAQETRQRLLAAASEVFAQKGFWEATHAEICQKAGANTAAVNYHFGSKENLYIESWKYAFETSVEAHPLDGGVGAAAPARDRLRGRVLAFMKRMTDPNNHEVEIMHKEMANPTGLLTEVIQQAVGPMRQQTTSVLQELLGDGATGQQVAFCEMSFMGLCFAPLLHLRHVKGHPHPPGPPLRLTVDELADHVTRFCLAGVRDIREEVRSSRKTGKTMRRTGQASRQERP